MSASCRATHNSARGSRLLQLLLSVLCVRMLSSIGHAREGPEQNGQTCRNVGGISHIKAELSEALNTRFPPASLIFPFPKICALEVVGLAVTHSVWLLL